MNVFPLFIFHVLASPIDTNRHSDYIETLEASKKLTRPTSAISTNGNDANSVRRSSMMSPLDLPSASPVHFFNCSLL